MKQRITKIIKLAEINSKKNNTSINIIIQHWFYFIRFDLGLSSSIFEIFYHQKDHKD